MSKVSAFTEINALEAFKAWDADPNLMVMACNTTDIKGEVIELAIVTKKNGIVYKTLLFSDAPITAGAAVAHGISEERLANKPKLCDVWPNLTNLLASGAVVAFAPNFIGAALRRTLKAQGIEGDDLSDMANELLRDLETNPALSVMDAYSYIGGHANPLGGFNYFSLAKALAQRGLGNRLLMSAAQKAERTLRLIEATAQLTPEDLPHLLPKAGGLFDKVDQKSHSARVAEELDRMSFDATITPQMLEQANANVEGATVVEITQEVKEVDPERKPWADEYGEALYIPDCGEDMPKRLGEYYDALLCTLKTLAHVREELFNILTQHLSNDKQLGYTANRLISSMVHNEVLATAHINEGSAALALPMRDTAAQNERQLGYIVATILLLHSKDKNPFYFRRAEHFAAEFTLACRLLGKIPDDEAAIAAALRREFGSPIAEAPAAQGG